MGESGPPARPWAAYAPWVLATAVGFVAGRLAAAGFLALLAPDPARAPVRALLVAYLALGLYGLVFGVAQRAALRPALPVAGWLLATTLGALLGIVVVVAVWIALGAQPPGSAAARFMQWPGRLLLAGALVGLIVAAGQWLVGRARGLVARTWLPLNALGLGAAELLVTVAGGVPPGVATPADGRTLVVGPFLGGLAYGLLTGTVLRRPRRR